MENGLYPFFWQHGESHTVLREYMGQNFRERDERGVRRSAPASGFPW